MANNNQELIEGVLNDCRRLRPTIEASRDRGVIDAYNDMVAGIKKLRAFEGQEEQDRKALRNKRPRSRDDDPNTWNSRVPPDEARPTADADFAAQCHRMAVQQTAQRAAEFERLCKSWHRKNPLEVKRQMLPTS